jgi:outer membrane beta-barrel protein
MTVKSVSASLPGALALCWIMQPSPARAEDEPRKSVPAVRHRILLVNNRLEFSPTFETSINADFRHTIGGGAKLEYHISDMWSIGAVGILGTSINTGLTTRIIRSLPQTNDDPVDPTPTRREFEDHLNKIPVHGAAYVTWTPWYGKLAAFAKAFVPFDFYLSGGLAFAKLDNDCCSFAIDRTPGGDPANMIPADRDPNNDDPLNAGNKYGVYMAGGIHVFLTEWLALDFSFRDYWFSDNPSGLDFDANLRVDEEDDRLLHHFFAGVGVSVLLPMRASRSP